jgi:hypothetical protein
MFPFLILPFIPILPTQPAGLPRRAGAGGWLVRLPHPFGMNIRNRSQNGRLVPVVAPPSHWGRTA